MKLNFSPPTFLSAAHFCSLLINFSYHNIISHSLNSCSFSVVYFHFPFILLFFLSLILCDIISFSKYVQHVYIYQSEHTEKKRISRVWKVASDGRKQKKGSAKRKQEEEWIINEILIIIRSTNSCAFSFYFLLLCCFSYYP